MSADSFLVRLVAALEAVGIPYMLTGSYASSLYGVPRSTQDIDLVIDASVGKLRRFVRSLPESTYYVNIASAIDALDRRSQFNVIDLDSGWKVDLIVRKERPFSVIEFGRRSEETIGSQLMWVASPEDVILAKLEWAKSAGSGRQIEDAAGILKVRSDLDEQYIAHWVRELHIENEWQEANKLAGREPSDAV